MTRLRKVMEGTDITGMSEINKNHYKLDHIKGIGSNIKRWNKHSRTHIEWIRDRDWKYEFQQGGVSLTSQGTIREYIQDTGGDQEGLGRWTWTTYEGSDKIKTAIIQVYRPGRNKKDIGSTYNQQVARSTGDPIRKFDEDLEALIQDFQEKGWRIVVMGDFNCNIYNNNHLTRCMGRRGLKDALKDLYGKGTPSTRKGSEVIDGIWISEGLEAVQGGCLPGDPTISDHKVEWVDITIASMLGERRGQKESAYRRRLHTSNKKAVKRYNEILQRQVKIHKLDSKAAELWSEVKGNKKLTESQRQRFEAIDDQRIRAMAHAEKKAIKIRPHATVFSPIVQEILCDIQVHRYVYERQLKGKRTNISTIRLIKSQWQVTKHYELGGDEAEMLETLKETYRKWWKVQKEAPALREDFMARKLEEAERKGEYKKAGEIRAIVDRERNKEVHQRLKGARGLLSRGGVRFVETHHPDGTKSMVHDKEDMEIEIAESNKRRVTQANET